MKCLNSASPAGNRKGQRVKAPVQDAGAGKAETAKKARGKKTKAPEGADDTNG